MKVSRLLLLAISIIYVFCNIAIPCTALRMHDGDHIYVGKNYDWGLDSGFLIVNKSGVAKTALSENNPAKWVSRYGSVTFNQYGRENPNGGMNEAGLVLEVLWLRSSEYPGNDDRKTVGNLQWVQYQLDNCATVEDVLKTDEVIRITGDPNATVHFFVADATGNTAVIEFLDGKMVAHSGEDMPIPVITNNTYDDSYKHACKFTEFNGKKKLGERKTNVEIFSREASLDRFTHAGVKVKEFKASDTDKDVEYVFESLELVRSGDRTVWQIVYDIQNREIHFRTIDSSPRKFINFNSVEFDCNSPVFLININTEEIGDISKHMVEYSYDLNYKYLYHAIRNTGFLSNMPEMVIKSNARYPDMLKCME